MCPAEDPAAEPAPGRLATRGVGQVVERLWRLPLLLASAVFVMSGPAQALGKTDAVFYAALTGLALGGIAVPLGLLALGAQPEDDRP